MYRLIKFGTTSLEYVNQVDQVGSGPTPVNYFALPDGGSVDGYGTAVKSPGAVERTKTVRLFATTVQGLSDLFLGLLQLRGKRDKLYRRMINGDEHWMYARLVEITATRSFEQTQYQLIQDVELKFVCQEMTWHGIERSEVSEAYPDSPFVFNLALGSEDDPGRAPSRAIRLHLSFENAAGVSESIVIARTGGESVSYVGPIDLSVSNHSGTLIVDTGTMQMIVPRVTNPYQYLTLSPTADMAAWFTLQPGDNQITFTWNSQYVSEVGIDFQEEWY